MAEKKEEIKAFNPTDQATLDAHETDFFGGRHFRIEKLGVISQRRGLVGSQIWTPKALSSPLRLFAKESRDMEEDKIDLLLNGLAAALGVDPHAIKRQFYAVRQNWEDQFLSDLDRAEQKRRKLEELAETAESEVLTPEEPAEKEEEE